MAKLAAYRAKRDFDRTREPAGSDAAQDREDALAFVIQKHDARRLHYDLRLELDGVMKSWAVAKGPSLVPGEKRLAVHVEDHPMEYNAFEGTIPQGQYGGGTVLLWDRGVWTPREDPHAGYRKGHLDFSLEGEKLHGAWHLVRMEKRPRERQESWLLIKQEDEAARPADAADILEEEPRSVASGRTLAEIAAEPEGRVWDARGEADEKPPAAPPPRKSAGRKRKDAATEPTADDPDPQGGAIDPAALTADGARLAMPKTLEPSLATLSDVLPKSGRWLHEIKWDGYRLLAFKTAQGVRLATRRGLDWTARFPAIAAAVAALPIGTAILDGEAVAEDGHGSVSFSALQVALSDLHSGVAHDAYLYAFDLLYVDGHDLRALPLAERKARLARLVPPGAGGAVRLSEHLEADGEAMARAARGLGLEGIVSKRRDRPYRSGRTADWQKVKFTERQEFVVAGFVPSTATPKAVGSLVLAYHEGTALRLAGRAGTGFTAEIARLLHGNLAPLKRRTPALSQKPSAEERRNVVWVEPKLVAEIEFRGWTGEDRLRHAAYKGLREDKPAEEVVREQAEKAPARSPAAKRRPKAAGAGNAGSDEIAGVRLSHPDRILWPDAGITKRGLADYYEEIAQWILPHVVERPLSLVRCPEGVAGSCFFQKHGWAGINAHIERRPVRDGEASDEVLIVRDLAGLVSLVQSSVLEIHPWGARIEDPEKADRITLDLDPGEGVAWSDVMHAAREVRERLGTLKLESFLKTTGGKGLHVVVPLAPAAPWARVKPFAKSIAEAMEADDPRRYLATASKAARRGRVYVDYLRNGRGATAIAAYSSRARPGAPVSVPIAWDELTDSFVPGRLTVESVPGRLAGLRTDPWAELAEIRQALPAARRGKR